VQDMYYNVADMQRAVRFYTEVLGLELLEGGPHWTSLSAGGVRVGLHWSGGNSVPLTPRDAHGPYNGGTLTLRSDDLGEDRRRLAAAGAPILGEQDAPWGQLLVFEDPDRNVLKLMKAKR
jgi:catechol 2,3-dioxygenase-like lactoylglutathione lyase family enzyme